MVFFLGFLSVVARLRGGMSTPGAGVANRRLRGAIRWRALPRNSARASPRYLFPEIRPPGTFQQQSREVDSDQRRVFTPRLHRLQRRLGGRGILSFEGTSKLGAASAPGSILRFPERI